MSRGCHRSCQQPSSASFLELLFTLLFRLWSLKIPASLRLNIANVFSTHDRYTRLIGVTTEPAPPGGSLPGLEHVSEDTFADLAKKGKLFEWVEHTNGYHYGLPKDPDARKGPASTFMLARAIEELYPLPVQPQPPMSPIVPLSPVPETTDAAPMSEGGGGRVAPNAAVDASAAAAVAPTS